MGKNRDNRTGFVILFSFEKIWLLVMADKLCAIVFMMKIFGHTTGTKTDDVINSFDLSLTITVVI